MFLGESRGLRGIVGGGGRSVVSNRVFEGLL